MDFASFRISGANHDGASAPVGIGRVAIVARPNANGNLMDALCVWIAYGWELFILEPVIFGKELGIDFGRNVVAHGCDSDGKDERRGRARIPALDARTS